MSMLMQDLDERLPKSDNVAQETHKFSVYVEQPSINKHILGGFKSSIEDDYGWFPKGIHIPKTNMRKFDGNDPITWIFQMEQFFDIHHVPNLQKVNIASLYLEPHVFVWYQWLCECKMYTMISWSIFIE